jgi:hypothetical protein
MEEPEKKQTQGGSGLESSACSTLGDALPKEIERCQELLGVYKSLGPVGSFGQAMISAEIAEAHKAMIEGDAVGMVRAYQNLKNCE